MSGQRVRFVPSRAKAAGASSADRVRQVTGILRAEYPGADCALTFRSPYELLAATILSAQCTDERVNQVSPALFARCPSPAALAATSQADVEALIRPTGFFRNKAKNLRGMARALVERHGGQVPRDMDALTALPGVGRKTANCIRGTAFGLPAMVVDTHVSRLARRLGWSREEDPVKIERDLMRLLPEDAWTWMGHALILHGRRICRSQRPRCSACPLADLCPSRA